MKKVIYDIDYTSENINIPNSWSSHKGPKMQACYNPECQINLLKKEKSDLWDIINETGYCYRKNNRAYPANPFFKWKGEEVKGVKSNKHGGHFKTHYELIKTNIFDVVHKNDALMTRYFNKKAGAYVEKKKFMLQLDAWKCKIEEMVVRYYEILDELLHLEPSEQKWHNGESILVCPYCGHDEIVVERGKLTSNHDTTMYVGDDCEDEYIIDTENFKFIYSSKHTVEDEEESHYPEYEERIIEYAKYSKELYAEYKYEIRRARRELVLNL